MISERRNELIAELFYWVHYIEKWGRGIRLILSKEPDTEFKEVGTHFIVVFKRKKIPISHGGGVSEGVNTLFNYIKINPGKRTPQFEEALDVPIKTIERWRLSNNSKINRKNVVNIHLDGRNTLISEAKVPFQAIMK